MSKLITFSLLLFSALNLKAETLPEKYASECDKLNLNINESNYLSPLISKDCSTIYVLPPIVGSVKLNKIKSYSNIEISKQCSRVDQLTRSAISISEKFANESNLELQREYYEQMTRLMETSSRLTQAFYGEGTFEFSFNNLDWERVIRQLASKNPSAKVIKINPSKIVAFSNSHLDPSKEEFYGLHNGKSAVLLKGFESFTAVKDIPLGVVCAARDFNGDIESVYKHLSGLSVTNIYLEYNVRDYNGQIDTNYQTTTFSPKIR